jgi:hypothetical protein
MSEYKLMLQEARDLVDKIASSLPERIQISALTLKSNIPFKVLSLRELLIHRVSDIAVPAIDLIERGKLIPGAILVRAVVETVALLFTLHERLGRFFEDKNIEELEKNLMIFLLASRNKTGPREAINVKNFVDRVEKTVPGFKPSYESLCEFAHPNWAGTLGAYGQPDKKKNELRLRPTDRTRALTIGVSALSGALIIFEYYYNSIGELVLNINDYFEKAESGRV